MLRAQASGTVSLGRRGVSSLYGRAHPPHTGRATLAHRLRRGLRLELRLVLWTPLGNLANPETGPIVVMHAAPAERGRQRMGADGNKEGESVSPRCNA
jgi:hypothetical protein